VPAHADPDTDAKFIQVLDDGNVPYTSTRSAIALAHVVCSNLTEGYTYFYNTNAVTEMNPAWTDFQDGYFVGVAVAAYCPDQRGKIPTPPH
jgi:hypothetical protein